jgi:predicted Zn-dependent peptidase
MSVRVSRLANGLRVASDSMTTVETASVGIWVGVGTRHEEADVNGVSHLLEHMAFKGTERRSALDIAEEIEAVGGHLNAYTSRENTAYFAKILKDDLPLAVDVIADIVQNSTMDEKELDRERDVIIQEIGQADDTPDDIIFDRFQETAFPDQALGRPVLGVAERIRTMERQTVVDYLRRQYSAPHMILAAAGNVDHDHLVSLAEEALSGVGTDGGSTIEPARYAGGEYRESRDLEQVHIVLGFQGVSYREDDFYSGSVLSSLFGGGMSSRLFQEVREKHGLVYSIYSFLSPYSDDGLFAVYAGTGEEHLKTLVPIVCDELCKIRETVTEDEVARARTQLKSSILMSLESTSSRCEQLARQLMVYGRPLPVDEIVGRIEAVDADGVMRAARRVTSSTPTLAALGPVTNLESFEMLAKRLQ